MSATIALVQPDAPESAVDPTATAYMALVRGFDFFNSHIFQCRLPPCLITLRPHGRVDGYFQAGRFGHRDGSSITDEIGLNAQYFKDRSTTQIMTTLVHQMVHVLQHHYGKKPSRNGNYHNEDFAKAMDAIGLDLTPRTGHRIAHMIRPGGPFDQINAELLATGFDIPYVEVWTGEASRSATAGDDAGKAGNKRATEHRTRKFVCTCCGLNAWGNAAIDLICGRCARADERLCDLPAMTLAA